MEAKYKSQFKDPAKDLQQFENWVKKLEKSNGRKYERHPLTTSLGKTHVWSLNSTDEKLETLVIFPGARTTALFWDFDKGLDNLDQKMKIFLVETNGLPNLSDGNTPHIHSLDFGVWAEEIFNELGIEKAFIAGASFGGLICMKFAIVAPERIKACFLLSPACLQEFSLSFKNLYYNLLPIFFPNKKNVTKFLNKAVISKPNHQLSEQAEKLFVEYEVFAIKRYKDLTQKPYFMGEELSEVTVDIYLLLGDKDLLFPFQKSLDHAKKHISTLKEIKVFANVGHGIETYDKAVNYMGEQIKTYHSRLAS